MSIQPEMLRDPSEAFLNQPGFLDRGTLTPPPQEPRPDHHPDFFKIAMGIAAALVVLRIVMKHELGKTEAQTPEEIRASADRIYKRIIPAWLQAAVPAVTQAYKLGSTGGVSYDELEKMATEYAAELGQYVNDSSILALTDAFNAQVNAGWSERLAWQRAREAYGLDSTQMRSYVKGLLAQDKANYVTDPIPATSRAFVDRAFLIRADRMGTNEAFKATQVGRNMVWLMLSSAGQLPPGTMKRWVTADDERVCVVCGPLDQVVIPLHRRFESAGRYFYAPGVHPNCRCTLEMVYPDLGTDVVKAMPGDPYDRNADGEFAEEEGRSALTKETKHSALKAVRGDLTALKAEDEEMLSALSTSALGTSALSQESALSAPSALSALDATEGASALSQAERKIFIVQNNERGKSALNEAEAVLNPEDPQVHDSPVVIPAETFLKALHIDRDSLFTHGTPVDLNVPHPDGVPHGIAGYVDFDEFDPGDSPAWDKAVADYMKFEGSYIHSANQQEALNDEERAFEHTDYAQYGEELDERYSPARRALAGENRDQLLTLIRKTIGTSEFAGYYIDHPDAFEKSSANEIAGAIMSALVNESADRERHGDDTNDGAWTSALYSLGEDLGTNDMNEDAIMSYVSFASGARGSEVQKVEPIFFYIPEWYGRRLPLDFSDEVWPSRPDQAEVSGKYHVSNAWIESIPQATRNEAIDSIMNRMIVVQLERDTPEVE